MADPLAAYECEADELLAAHRAGDERALRVIHERHPRFLDKDVRWLPLRLTPDDIRAALFDEADARLTVARCYDFLDWDSLASYVTAAADPGSPECLFESAVEAVVNGNLPALEALLAAHPELAHARSTRVTHFDPPVHRATLLHYVAANGVEGFRQKTPPNVVAITEALLRAGADPNALADLYGGQCTVMSMLVSSSHPATAGVQVPLIDLLVDHGASVESLGGGNWTSPLMTALVFNFRDAAEALVRRGARVEDVATAAGLGRLADVERLLPGSTPESRHRALALAAQLGHAEIVRLLLDAGEEPNRFNPPGLHAHGTPLHNAAHAGHEAVVRLLVERGARLEIKDKLWQSTPLGWAQHGGRDSVTAFLSLSIGRSFS